MPALRHGKRVGHAPANEQVVHLIEQLLDDENLVRNLGPTHNGREGPLGVLQHFFGVVDFGLQQVAAHPVLWRKGAGHHGRGGVGAVRGAEGIVHVHIAQGRQLSRESRVAGFFFLVKTQVIEQQHLAGLQRRRFPGRFVAEHVAAPLHVAAILLLQVQEQAFERKLLLGAALGPAQVREQHHRAAIVQDFHHRRRGHADAGIVGDVQVFIEGHVEIDAHHGALAGEIVGVEGIHREKQVVWSDRSHK